MRELWRKFAGVNRQEIALIQPESTKPYYIYTLDSFFTDHSINPPNKLLVEVNAGNNPMGAVFAQRFPHHLVVSQDIQTPQADTINHWLNQTFNLQNVPDNFFYLIGNSEKFPQLSPSAVFSFFPLPQQQTVDWLSKTIQSFAEKNHNMYALIVTENATTGITAYTKNIFSLKEPLLQALDACEVKVNIQSISFDTILHNIPTLWYQQLGNMYKDVTIIEANPQRREEFIGAFSL